jgi:hypothetical protein
VKSQPFALVAASEPGDWWFKPARVPRRHAAREEPVEIEVQ